MLNHFRTLLANLPPTQAVGETIAEEPIPPEFAPLRLPSYLTAARRMLFGADPDRSFVNYLTRQCMTLLHNSRHVDHVLALDSRVAYSVGEDAGLLPRLAFQPVVSPRGPDAQPGLLVVTGAPAPPDASGRMRFVFEVETLSEDAVESKRVTPYAGSSVYALVMSDGLSAALPLAGSGYSFRLRDNQSGRRWGVEILNRPQRSLGQVLADLETLGEESLTALFGASPAEPYATFANLWRDSPELPDRLVGFLLALVYRTEEIRQTGGGNA